MLRFRIVYGLVQEGQYDRVFKLASGLLMVLKQMQEQEAQDWLSAQGDNEEEYYDEADADESTTAATQAPVSIQRGRPRFLLTCPRP